MDKVIYSNNSHFNELQDAILNLLRTWEERKKSKPGSVVLSANDLISAIADYCLEMTKETELNDKQDPLTQCREKYWPSDYCKGCIAYRECKESTNPVKVHWYDGILCPVHSEDQIISMDFNSHGAYAIGFKCGCTFRVKT